MKNCIAGLQIGMGRTKLLCPGPSLPHCSRTIRIFKRLSESEPPRLLACPALGLKRHAFKPCRAKRARADSEGRTRADATGNLNRAAVRLDDRLGNCQAEPLAARGTRLVRVKGNAQTRVAKLEPQFPGHCRITRAGRGRSWFPISRALGRRIGSIESIGQQIRDDLCKPGRHHPHIRTRARWFGSRCLCVRPGGGPGPHIFL
jgi:hypothetical protein